MLTRSPESNKRVEKVRKRARNVGVSVLDVRAIRKVWASMSEKENVRVNVPEGARKWVGVMHGPHRPAEVRVFEQRVRCTDPTQTRGLRRVEGVE